MSEKNVLSHRQFGKEQQRLVNRCDSGVVGVPGRGEPHGFPVHQYFALIRLVKSGHDLDERGFSCAAFAHECIHFTWANIEAHAAQDLDAGK